MTETAQRPQRRWPAAVPAALLIVIVALHRIALADLRAVERDYVASRTATACAIASLEPFTRGEDLDDLEAAVATAVATAAEEVSAGRAASEGRSVLPYPGLRAARAGVVAALRAQDTLYSAMLSDPQDTDAFVTALGERNAGAERALASARRWLLVGPGAGWEARGVCA